MDHDDHVDLLCRAVEPGPAVWAELGSGTGAFTLALAELVGPDGTIISVDRDRGALQRQREQIKLRGHGVSLSYLAGDFTEPLDLPALDGLLMANSLHYVVNKAPVLRGLRQYLKPGGTLIVVEYDTDDGNWAVPHPISFESLSSLLPECGFEPPRLIGSRPSRFLGRFYSAASRPAWDEET